MDDVDVDIDIDLDLVAACRKKQVGRERSDP